MATIVSKVLNPVLDINKYHIVLILFDQGLPYHYQQCHHHPMQGWILSM